MVRLGIQPILLSYEVRPFLPRVGSDRYVYGFHLSVTTLPLHGWYVSATRSDPERKHTKSQSASYAAPRTLVHRVTFVKALVLQEPPLNSLVPGRAREVRRLRLQLPRLALYGPCDPPRRPSHRRPPSPVARLYTFAVRVATPRRDGCRVEELPSSTRGSVTVGPTSPLGPVRLPALADSYFER